MLLNSKGNGYWYMLQMWLVKKSQSQRLYIVWFHLLSSKWLDYEGGDERNRDGENRDECGRGWVWL